MGVADGQRQGVGHVVRSGRIFQAQYLADHELHQEEVDAALAELKGLPKPSLAKTGKW